MVSAIRLLAAVFGMFPARAIKIAIIAYTGSSLVHHFLNRNWWNDDVENWACYIRLFEVHANKLIKKSLSICPSMVNALFDFDVTHFLWVLQLIWLMQLSVWWSASGRDKNDFLPLKCTNRITVDENKIASKPPGHNSRSKGNWPPLTWHRPLALHLWLNLEYYKSCAAYF